MYPFSLSFSSDLYSSRACLSSSVCARSRLGWRRNSTIYSVFSTEAPSIPSNTPVYTLLNGDQPMKLVHVDRHLRSPRAQCGFVVSTRTFIPIIQISGDLSLDDRSSLVSRTKSVQFSRVCYSPFFCTSGVHLIQFCVFSDFGIGNVQCCVFR